MTQVFNSDIDELDEMDDEVEPLESYETYKEEFDYALDDMFDYIPLDNRYKMYGYLVRYALERLNEAHNDLIQEIERNNTCKTCSEVARLKEQISNMKQSYAHISGYFK